MSEADSSDDFELLFLNKTKEETTSLMSFLTSLLWAVSRVSLRVVKEPDCMTFLLAALYLLWGKSGIVIRVNSLNSIWHPSNQPKCSNLICEFVVSF